jgi:hypothetical protein
MDRAAARRRAERMRRKQGWSGQDEEAAASESPSLRLVGSERA